MISSKQIRAAWFDAGTLIQHSGISGFRKWDGALILYHGLITAPVVILRSATLDMNMQYQKE